VSIRHDYKSAATGQRRQRARRYGLLVMTLVLIGLFGGLLAYIRGDRTPSPPGAAASAPTTPAQPPAAPPPPKTVAVSPAEPEPVKPKYDFYTELPKRKIAIQRETVKPGNASRPAPTRIQPAANPLQKPAAPRRNAVSTSPTMATASGAKPDSKTANSKTANSKTANSKTADSKTANSKTANSKTTNSKTANTESANSKAANSKATNSKTANSKIANTESANSKATNSKTANSTSTSTNSRPATAKPTPAAPPARTAQPLRPFTNNNSKIVVKTEQAP
jgi:hypothetical protein